MARVAVPLADELAEEAVLRVCGRIDSTPYRSVTNRFSARIETGASIGAAPAGVLARRGADPTADRREGVRRAGDEEGLLVTALRDELDVPPGVRRNRTTCLTFDLRLPIRQGRDASPDRHVESPCAREDRSEGAGPV